MEPTPSQQIIEQITKANKILVALPSDLETDIVGSAIALALFLRKIEKEVDIVSTGSVPAELDFLPESKTIKETITVSNSLVISIDTSEKELEEISYQTAANKVSVYIKPKGEQFTEEDVTFTTDKAPYSLVIVLGAASLENLGKLFEDHSDIFFETPKVNIDNDPANKYFGAINLVDINSTSIAEILAGLLGSYEQQLIDEDIATCLLAGIITKTNSFQHAQTTPQAFLKASELIGFGARQQEVIKFLYKTKPLQLLRLWGRALARLKMQDDCSLVYSLLNLSDFGKSGASGDDLMAVLKEFIDNISSYKIIALVTEVMGGSTRILFAAHTQVQIETMVSEIGGTATEMPSGIGLYKVFDITLENISLNEAETKLLDACRGKSKPVEQSLN